MVTHPWIHRPKFETSENSLIKRIQGRYSPTLVRVRSEDKCLFYYFPCYFPFGIVLNPVLMKRAMINLIVVFFACFPFIKHKK